MNALLSAAILACLLAGSAWLAQDASANFAASPGFSGRNGATCLACHTVAPIGHVDATAIIEGLPESWTPGQTYHLSIRVEGGPQAMPAPQPQGGLDLSIDGGALSVPAPMQGLLRTPNPQEITYLPAGTLMRAWQADWTAPNLAERPADRHVWLAVLAADGNHVVATNTSDGGERFDSAANLTATVPPSDAALAAWRGLPLLAPTATVEVHGGDAHLEGRHADGNATSVLWRLDGGPWASRASGPAWRIDLEGLRAGAHRLDFRSEGSDRRSPDQTVSFEVPGLVLPGSRASPGPGFGAVVLIAVVLATVRNRP